MREPICNECHKPMRETSLQNAQVTLPDGRRFDCQESNCSQWAPEGVGCPVAWNLKELINTHEPDNRLGNLMG
jgi:hypothetical protein